MSGHTPGVWIAHANGEWFHIKAHTDALVAVVAKCESVGPENEANARLIAAAPELKEALAEAIDALVEMLPRIRGAVRTDEITCRGQVAGIIAKGQAALAKAEGRQP